MSEAVQSMSETVQALDGASQRHIRFVGQITGDDAVLMTFKDPAPGYAVLCEVPATATSEVAAESRGDVLDVVLLPWPTLPQGTPLATNQGFAEWIAKGDGPDASPPVLAKVRGVELMWRPGRVLLQCDSEQAESLLSAVVEFTHYERELRRIEQEIADTWEELEQDKALAFEVTPADLERSQAVGARMNRVLQRRIRLARIEPHLYEPGADLTAAGRKLGEELREKTRSEARLETVDGQLEVFEGIYEMSGQRMGEYRAARQEHVLEWIIIVLLAAEMLLLLAQIVWKSRV
jgi:hypothetical protein